MILELVTAKTHLKELATPTEHYDFFAHSNEERVQMHNDMLEAMKKHNGLGISANQLGLPWSVFVMRDPEHPITFNPKLVQGSEEIVNLEEACLSFPGLVLKIKRPKHIRVRFAKLDGDMNTHTFTGITARVIQHELDHLAGRMWFHSVNRLHLERAIKHAKKKGFDYSSMGLFRYLDKSAAKEEQKEQRVTTFQV